ncbi:unnamed protein product [Nezara viridula]|uniref:Uncharacterized protein n=1 Tax=Nezara viridula TaxID=85310 RepID=A0A9P0H1Q9_NEZVI|nr:unnamed protein product [Nezara viridula]
MIKFFPHFCVKLDNVNISGFRRPGKHNIAWRKTISRYVLPDMPKIWRIK